MNMSEGAAQLTCRVPHRVELDGLSHLALEQPTMISLHFDRIQRQLVTAAHFPVLCAPAIELLHTLMHTIPSNATAQLVLLLADCVDTLSTAGSKLLHFGHQVQSLI